MTPTIDYGVFILACFAAAGVWTLGGYVSDWRKNKGNPAWNGFDKKALRDDMILSGILGGLVVIYQAATEGSAYSIAIPHVETLHDFLILSGGMFTAVALCDKYLAGGFLGIISKTIPDLSIIPKIQTGTVDISTITPGVQTILPDPSKAIGNNDPQGQPKVTI